MSRSRSSTSTPPVRTRLSQAVSVALIFSIASPHVFAANAALSSLQDSEAAAQARRDEYAKRLPDIGRDTARRSTEAQNTRLLQEAVAYMQTGSTDALIDKAANAGLASGMDALRDSGLPFLGSLQGGVVYNSSLNRFDFDVLTMLRLYGSDEGGHTLLTQLGAHNLRDRKTGNAGLVYRWIDPAGRYLLGANLFYDHDFDAGAKRWGMGVEAATDTSRVFANTYAPLGGWVDSPTVLNVQERPARGHDLGVAWTPRALSMLDLQLKGAQWQGDAVDVFNTGKTEVDPTVWSARIGLAPVSALKLGLEHSVISGGEEDTRLSVTWTHQFGVPASQQWTLLGNGPRTDVRTRALAPVEREKRIIMDTRDKDTLPAFAAALVQVQVFEGVAFEQALAVTGGALPLTFALSGADAALFRLNGTTLQLPAQDAGAPADAGADNIYDVTVSVTDRRGRMATQRVAVTVQSSAPTARNARIEGTAQVGTPLTLRYDYYSPLGEAEDVAGRSIQWVRRPATPAVAMHADTHTTQTAAQADQDIAGATGETYAPVAGDAGFELGVRLVLRSVTGKTNVNVPVRVYSPVVGGGGGEVEGSAPTATPSITGTLRVGQPLTGVVGYADADGDAAGTHLYQWYRATAADGAGAVAIAGATGPTYALTVDDRGQYLTFEVTPKSATGKPDTGTPARATTLDAIVGNAPTAAPVITGEPGVGMAIAGEVHYADADGDAEGAHAIQWYRADDALGQNRVAVPGATTLTYDVTGQDDGKYLVFEVTPVSLGAGAAEIGQAVRAVTRVAVAVPGSAPTATVSIGGGNTVGSRLTSTVVYDDADGDPEDGTTYQWYRITTTPDNTWIAIPGATSVEYVLAKEDQSHYVALEVTPRSSSGVPSVGAAVRSTPTAGVIGVAPVATPRITGTVAAGSTVTGEVGYSDADGDAEGTHTYQWFRADDAAGTTHKTPISGATNATYELVTDDIGKYLVFEVTPKSATGFPNTGTLARAVSATAAIGRAPTASVRLEKLGVQYVAVVDHNDADGDAEGTHLYQWYRATDAAGTDRVPVGTSLPTYVLAGADSDHYMVLEVTPKSAAGTPNTGQTVTAISEKIENQTPTATSTIALTGARVVGNAELTGTVDYKDFEGDAAGTHVYQWYRADKADGTNKVAIPGATTATYTPVVDDQGKHLLLEVTPRTLLGQTGAPTLSTNSIAMPWGQWNPQSYEGGTNATVLAPIVVSGRPGGASRSVRFVVGRANVAHAHADRNVSLISRDPAGSDWLALQGIPNGGEGENTISGISNANGEWRFSMNVFTGADANAVIFNYVTMEFLD